MGRSEYSDKVLDLLCRDGWTRDVPLAFQVAMFPGVTPARESTGGRGAVFFDVWRRTAVGSLYVDQAAGFKIVGDVTKNNSMILTKGTEEHVERIVNAAWEGGVPLPVIVLAYVDDLWISTSFDLQKLVRTYGVHQATQGQGKGRGHASAVSWGNTEQVTRKRDRSGNVREYTYNYKYLQVNLTSANLEYEEVKHPAVWDFSHLAGTYYR